MASLKATVVMTNMRSVTVHNNDQVTTKWLVLMTDMVSIMAHSNSGDDGHGVNNGSQ